MKWRYFITDCFGTYKFNVCLVREYKIFVGKKDVKSYMGCFIFFFILFVFFGCVYFV